MVSSKDEMEITNKAADEHRNTTEVLQIRLAPYNFTDMYQK